MTSRADEHDVDKLSRWRRDLADPAGSPFPAYAIFLVSADDRAAHDVFRAFRSRFEACHAGFEHLVIFGQHGVSTTVRAMLLQFGLPPEALPALALLSGPKASTVYCLRLPPGDATALDAEQSGALWRTVLDAVAAASAASDEDKRSVDLAGIDGLAQYEIAREPLLNLVDRLLADLR